MGFTPWNINQITGIQPETYNYMTEINTSGAINQMQL